MSTEQRLREAPSSLSTQADPLMERIVGGAAFLAAALTLGLLATNHLRLPQGNLATWGLGAAGVTGVIAFSLIRVIATRRRANAAPPWSPFGRLALCVFWGNLLGYVLGEFLTAIISVRIPTEGADLTFVHFAATLAGIIGGLFAYRRDASNTAAS